MNAKTFDSPEIDSLEDDREWSALRYVLGEMSPAETDAFETLLATDQETRELVAQSTGVIANLLELSPHEATASGSCNGSRPVGRAGLPVATTASAAWARRPSERTSAWAITGLVAAVCCCVAAGVCLLPFVGRTAVEGLYSGDLTENGAGHLVAIWSQRLAELAPETATTEATALERSDVPLPDDADNSRLTTATENAAADSAAVGDQIAADDSDVPGWMIAAIAIGQSHKPGGSSSEIWEN